VRDNPLPILISDLETAAIEEANDAFLALLGLSRDRVIGRTGFEIGLWKDAAQREALLEELSARGAVRQRPFSFAAPDGTAREFLLSFHRIGLGGRTFLLTAAEDVTHLERARRELAESERRFAVAFRANPAGLSLSRLRDGVFLDVNDAFAELVGLPREAMVGRSAFELGLWPDADSRQRAFAPILAGGFARRVPARVRGADGQPREARISGSSFELDGERCILVLAEDVTELNRAQQALEQSERRFRAALDGSADAFLLLEAQRDATGQVVDFRLVDANRSATRQIGREREELVGRSLLESCPLHQDREMFERYRRAFEEGQLLEGEYRTSAAKRRPRLLRTQVVPLSDAVAIWFRDVTELRSAEAEHRRKSEEFHRGQRLESLGLLAGGVAHDFNNLLTAILGYAEVAARRLPEAAPAAAPVAEISRAARRAADLTQKMLAFAGGGAMEVAWIALNEIVREMLDLVRPALPPGRRILAELAQPSPGLEADATQMRQVVLNLALNASEAIAGDGGTIEVATGESSCDRERLDAAVLGAERREGRYAWVRVADDGAGLPAEVRDRIFEPFVTTKFTGRGLGLAAVLGIVRAHHGAIEVESRAGGGTSFTVLVPIAQPPATDHDDDAPGGVRLGGA